jgi:hypothetical protein
MSAFSIKTANCSVAATSCMPKLQLAENIEFLAATAQNRQSRKPIEIINIADCSEDTLPLRVCGSGRLGTATHTHREWSVECRAREEGKNGTNQNR